MEVIDEMFSSQPDLTDHTTTSFALLAAAGQDTSYCPLTPVLLPPERWHPATGHTCNHLPVSNTLSDSDTARIVFPSILRIKIQCLIQGAQVQFLVREEYFSSSLLRSAGTSQVAPHGEGRNSSPTTLLSRNL
uniref:Uncharacterized protein n=1 Tax=Rousettus aegyptiacus TaxID=9407 RepID=A0A7J8BRJ2_ROUAE|nr:hypothetical protein HJG63_009573 [Rousettus aegyptiacus]